MCEYFLYVCILKQYIHDINVCYDIEYDKKISEN